MRRLPTMMSVMLAAAAPFPALAQALQCSPPRILPGTHPETPDEEQPRRVMPIGGYSLAIMWSPQVCAGPYRRSEGFRCDGGNRFGFTLHGLWPDGKGKSWPQYCRSEGTIPAAVTRANLCVTPSAQLIRHEWSKHGTCMTSRPADYFNTSRALFERLHFPDMKALARRRELNAGDLADAFASANIGLRPDMMRITATRAGWLDEVWMCLDTRLSPTRCVPGKGGLPRTARLKVRMP